MKNFYKKIYTVFIISCILAHYSAAEAADNVIVSGETVGIKIYTDGVIVADTAEFKDTDGKGVCPARDAGIKAGDVVKTVNGQEITSCDDLMFLQSSEPINCEISRGGENFSAAITPLKAEDGAYRIGIWARDSTAGIGTMTFINPETSRYTALGHAVTDIDTGNIMTVNKGNIQDCTINSVTKGHIGFPGSVSADFMSEVLGSIDKNAENGIAGSINALPQKETVKVAEISDIHNGEAYILSDVINGEVTEYEAKVEIISNDGIRNMVIEIIDPALKEATGGIIQGMSGAPIMQNGQLIGAVTHVFINDPHKGYAIFAKKLVE